MKRIKIFINLLLAMTVIGFASCNSDDPVIVIDEGLSVADGFYIAKTGDDPVATAQLTASTVDAPSFSAMSREGFFQTYAFLTAGEYNLVEVGSKEIVNIYGGTLTTVSGEDVRNKECDTDNSSYNLVAATVDGAAFSVASDGFYVIAYDDTMGEIVYDKIETAGIIGAATPGGWGADTELSTATVTATGASWTLEDVTIDVGELKFRFNCRWAIDRRIDPLVDFDNSNGYSFFTNFGNSIDQLKPGNEGPNIQNDEYANFTVTLTWDPITGFAASLVKTGEAEPKPEYPEELYMIGGSLGGWDWGVNGIQMIPVHSNPHLFWRIVWLDNDTDTPLSPPDPGLKFAPQADWIGDFGVNAGTGATDGVWSKGSDNFPGVTESGYYMVVVNLETGAETIEVNEPLVYGIGDAFGSWDVAKPEYLFTVDNVNKLITSPAFAADGNLRIFTTASTFTPVGTDPAIEWWQAEFVVIGGTIEYRSTGGDQAAQAVTAGQNVSLNFKDGTGTVN